MEKQIKRDLEILNQYKKLAIENNDRTQWHQLCTVINNWSSYPENVREQIMDCVLKHAVCRYKI